MFRERDGLEVQGMEMCIFNGENPDSWLPTWLVKRAQNLLYNPFWPKIHLLNRNEIEGNHTLD